MSFVQLFLVISAVLTLINAEKCPTWQVSLDKAATFQFGSCDQKYGPMTGRVPGSVHTDLIQAGIVTSDPYFRFEESNLTWIPQQCWEYRSSSFDLPSISDNCELHLQLDNLDSVASITLNGIAVGSTANAQRRHDLVIPGSAAQKTDNVLIVTLHPALDYNHQKAKEYPYVVPFSQTVQSWTEPSDRNFLRKAGSDFGWDWGPGFINTGINGGITFYQASTAKLTGLIIEQQFPNEKDFSNVEVDAFITLNAPQSPKTSEKSLMKVNLFVNNNHQLSTTIDYSHCSLASNKIISQCKLNVGKFVIEKPDLWWPAGYGKQSLYTFTIKTEDGQQLTKKIGFRTIKLVQTPLSQLNKENGKKVEARSHLKTGLNNADAAVFYFEINSLPIFMKGVNFIPIDSFHSRVTEQDRAYLLHVASLANMNMLRVWGGGIYQPDDFYELADELGIMIWQEIMLACALYPRNQEFLMEVSLEVEDQIIRLNSHPSIVVIGGNNENEAALLWYAESINNRDLFVTDYSQLYGNTIYPILIKILGSQSVGTGVDTASHQFVWVDSSPSNGLIATNPYAKHWGNTGTDIAGDLHFYYYQCDQNAVQCDCENYNSYPVGKFISEFGFQGMPSFLTYQDVTVPEDWDPKSDFIKFRQRHADGSIRDGNAQIEDQVLKHFKFPTTVDSSSIEARQRYFDMYLYLTQLQQSRCYETAINRWRQLHGIDSNNNYYTMGTLYWQLNDIWQAPSWASIEYGGQWRPLHSTIRRVYQSVIVSSSYVDPLADYQTSTEGKDNEFKLYGINDLPVDISIQWEVNLKTWSTGEVKTTMKNDNVLLTQGKSTFLMYLLVSETFVNENGCSFETCYFKITYTSLDDQTNYHGEQILPLTSMKNTQFSVKTDITFNNFQQVSSNVIQFNIQTSENSPFLFMEMKKKNLSFDGERKKKENSINVKGIFDENAGWFSDNNFHAEKNVIYTITYTSFGNKISVDEVKNRLQARSIQHAYNPDLPLFYP